MVVSVRPEDTPEYRTIKELKDARGAELVRRYGAHAIGIGWKRTGGRATDRLALIFYVERKPGPLDGEAVPPVITFTPAGSDRGVEVPTDVVESPPAVFE